MVSGGERRGVSRVGSLSYPEGSGGGCEVGHGNELLQCEENCGRKVRYEWKS